MAKKPLKDLRCIYFYDISPLKESTGKNNIFLCVWGKGKANDDDVSLNLKASSEKLAIKHLDPMIQRLRSS